MESVINHVEIPFLKIFNKFFSSAINPLTPVYFEAKNQRTGLTKNLPVRRPRRSNVTLVGRLAMLIFPGVSHVGHLS